MPDLTPALAMLDIAPDAILLVEADGRITFANQQVEAVFGWAAQDLVGQPVEVLLPPEARSRHVGHRTAFAEDAGVREMGAGDKLSGLHRDGTEVAVEISLSPLPDAPTTTMATIRDVSDRRAISDALAAALDHERAAAEELRRAGELRDEFLDIAAHELRSPLASISGFIETLTRHWSTRDDAWRLHMLERIGANASTMLERTERLLDATHLRSGHATPVLQSVDVAELVAATIATLEELDHRDVVASCATNVITTDRSAITHVVTNLLTNAAKYSSPDTKIEVEVRTVGNGVEIVVRDHGVGIAEKHLDHVFDHGFRGRASEAVRGSGVGLRVAQQFAEALGGHIEAASTEGEGSTFTAWFPDAG